MSSPETHVTSAVLVATAVTALGPVVGPYVVILIGSVWGGTLAITTTKDISRREGALILVRAILMGVGFSSVISWAISNWLPASWAANSDTLLLPVAVFTGWSADKMGLVRDRLLGKFFNGGAAQ